MDKSRDSGFQNFDASRSWLTKIKQDFNIVSRKITNIVSLHHESENNATIAQAAEFTNSINELLSSYDHDFVFNTDQSGFNYIMHSSRTLSNVGESDTTVVVESTNATTHSYTIQVLVSANGKLLDPLLLCLKEQGGTFGPRVFENLFKPYNCRTICSPSGKMTKNLVRYWAENFLKPNCQMNSLLLLDSWTGQSDERLFQFSDTTIEVKHIPPRTTPIIQPLDVYFFDNGIYLLEKYMIVWLLIN
ncbi:Pogo transposable element with KRAB domain-like protein, partial [Dinothrombium tinctorium]